MIDLPWLTEYVEGKHHHSLTDRELLVLILEVSVSNATALTALEASVTALTAAAAQAPADISAGVESAVGSIDAITTQLGGTPPPAASTGADTTPAADVPPAPPLGGQGDPPPPAT